MRAYSDHVAWGESHGLFLRETPPQQMGDRPVTDVTRKPAKWHRHSDGSNVGGAINKQG